MADSEVAAETRATLVLVTGDLFLGSRIRGVAELAGYAVTTVAGFARDLDAISESESRRVIVDLVSPGVDVNRLTNWLGNTPSSQVLAYAPHVRHDLLKAARAAEVGTVLVRSQLDSELPRWLATSP